MSTDPVVGSLAIDIKVKLAVFAGANAVILVGSGVRVATGGLLHDSD